MDNKKYKVVITQSGKMDIVQRKKYIIRHFKYREYAESFSIRIKLAIKELETFPSGYGTTGFQYRNYKIYMKPYNNYLLFYTINEQTSTVTILRILQDGMDWQSILEQWLHRTV